MSPRLVFPVVAAVITLFVSTRSAHAGGSSSCGGSSSSSDSSSSSSSSSSDNSSSWSSGDDSSSSSSEVSAPPACVEASWVVGHSHCPRNRFGRWNIGRVPALRISTGTSVHRFSLESMNFAGTAPHQGGIAYRMTGDEAAARAASAVTWDLSLTLGFGRIGYAGLQGKIGRTIIDGQRSRGAEGLALESSGNVFAEYGAVAGIAVPIGNLTVAADAFVGRRSVGIEVASRHVDCVGSSVSLDHQWLVQPRVSVESWVTPWFSVGGQLGSTLGRTGDVSVGMFLRGHIRAFDASRRR